MSENTNEQEEEVVDTGADTTQEEETQEEETDKVTMTAEEHKEMTEKLARYKAERDRLRDKKPTSKNEASPLVEKAFLNSAGFTTADEQAEVIKLAKNMNLDLDEAVYDTFVKERIEHLRKVQKDSAAMPNSKKRGSTTDDVSYWVNKGELPPKGQTELRRKVIDARYKGSKTANKFNN